MAKHAELWFISFFPKHVFHCFVKKSMWICIFNELILLKSVVLNGTRNTGIC